MKEEEKPDKETIELARAISNWINRHDHWDYPKLVQLWSQDHRTLQQKWTAVCLLWFVSLSKLTENWYDLRNKAAVEIAKKIVAENPDIKYGLPLI